MVSETLERAGLMIDKGDTQGAIVELEKGLVGLEVAGEQQPDAWRIESVLAALYTSLGKKTRARQLALSAHQHALTIGCPIATARTRALVERLDAGTPRQAPRLARGSRRFDRRR
jgi:hypothetical protein